MHQHVSDKAKGDRDMSGNQQLRREAFIVTSASKPKQDSAGNEKSTYTINAGGQRVHVTNRESLRRAVAAAMKDHRQSVD